MITDKNSRLKYLMKYLIYLLFFVAPLALTIKPAFAHRVNVFAWVEENTVYIQSKFMGGKPPHKAKVEVFDLTGNRILQGETDSNGEFNFQIGEKIPMRIVLTAGIGHQAVWVITEDDFQDTAAHSPGARMTETASTTTSDVLPETIREADTQNGVPLNEDEIRAIVEETLDRKLKPLMRMLIDSRANNITLTDILGGIGYIVGLIGLAAYINYRRKKE